MKIRKFLLLFVVFATIFTVAGCSVSIDDEVSQAQSQVEKIFNSKPLAPNKKSHYFSYHLPDNFEIQKSKNNNVVFNRGKQTYILFVNPEEKSNSTLMYETLAPKSDKFVLKTSFRKKDRLGYIAVKKVGNDFYETSVGIGGVKMTTDSKANAIAKSAEEMMNIVSSVQIK